MNVLDADTILLVESDVIVRHPLAEYLRGCGYRVREASSGDEARALLADPEAAISLVLLDIETSGAGFELAQWCRAHCPHVEVVMAGSIERAAEKAGEICGDGPALRKPYDHKVVLDGIKRAIARRERERLPPGSARHEQ